MKKIIEIYGWLGTFSVIGAYALVSFSFIESSSLVYQFLNLFGALGIVLSSYTKRNMQPVILNIFWGLIALIAIVNLV
jgi:branched-subunit amino acid transport protein AzlD